MKTVKVGLLFTLLLYLLKASPAYGDFFGGDLPLLAKIVANTIQQISELQKIAGLGKENLQYFRDLNRGLNEALNLAKTVNQQLSPGVLSDLQGAEQALKIIQELYGAVPKTAEARMQQTMDRSAAEAIDLHNAAFRYADEIDPQAEQIKDYARVVSPQGAEKLTAQSLGVLIQVLNQVLRTNATMLKLQSQQLALENKRAKVGSEQFRLQYESLARAFGSLRPEYRLSGLGINH